MLKISEVGLYNYLTWKQTPGLKENVKLMTVKRGKQLYDTSHKYTDIYEIISGAVKLGGVSGKGREYIYELVTPGEFFGNLAMLGGDTFSEFGKAIASTQLRIYKPAFFKHLMTHDPEVAAWSFEKIVYRWNKTESMLANIRSYEPRERITLLYEELQKKTIMVGNREIILNRLLTLQDIADLTGTTRQLAADTLNAV
ncbi:Crp/Fnr family transcriptional regulator [Chitinophaga sp. Cy-1792]|uniref:Crp/Fnr family transcriptional regulator n=1 Tax=Chitinophaga sp. Cy-1792 TaxID=2608339 RepID=UPI001420B1BC|nr:Crp/Fnr family transcriptional regulator [Chitinophaga sp. Cy-1792]NIG54429.1 Crp/Fnr family transcriptional regulator [Chitinophaga sp. Cy-1792]